MIKVKKLTENAIIPTRAHDSDAGLDLVYSGPVVHLPAKARMLMSTGIAMAIPVGSVGLIWPRSGLSVKNGIDVLAGVIDAGYRGEIKVALINLSEETMAFYPGDKIAQLLIQQVNTLSLTLVDDLGTTVRDSNGFGSTGK